MQFSVEYGLKRKDPTPGTQRNLYSTGWRWGFALGETQILAFSDTNMLVSPTQNSGVGRLSQRQGTMQLFCVAGAFENSIAVDVDSTNHTNS